MRQARLLELPPRLSRGIVCATRGLGTDDIAPTLGIATKTVNRGSTRASTDDCTVPRERLDMSDGQSGGRGSARTTRPAGPLGDPNRIAWRPEDEIKAEPSPSGAGTRGDEGWKTLPTLEARTTGETRMAKKLLIAWPAADVLIGVVTTGWHAIPGRRAPWWGKAHPARSDGQTEARRREAGITASDVVADVADKAPAPRWRPSRPRPWRSAVGAALADECSARLQMPTRARRYERGYPPRMADARSGRRWPTRP